MIKMKFLVFAVIVCAVMAQTSDLGPEPENHMSEDVGPEPETENQMSEDAGELSEDVVQRSSGQWQTYNGHSYIFIGSTMTWGRAQTHCLALGGSLAIIHNSNQEHFVRVSVAGQRLAWIGLSDAQNEGYWLWINSDPLVYTKWCPKEPNNRQGKQHCATINYSSQKCWDDEICSHNLPFVCQKVAQN